MKIPFQDLRRISPRELAQLEEAAVGVIRSGWYINGREAGAFEEELARSCGAKHCVAVSNGLDALRLILRGYMAMGRLHPGDEVIVPANTFIATFLAVSDAGLTPVPADIDEADFCIDFSRLTLTGRTRAIIIVHLYGNPCWNLPAMTALHDRGILIIEDNAQAIGARAASAGLNGSPLTGNLADASAISFYPAKNVGALGDAGAVCTSDAALAATIRTLANYGSDRKYHHVLRGFNCRMDEMQAAMLRVRLPHLDAISDARAATARAYDSLIDNPLITKPRIFTDRRQVWHQYVVRTPRRDALRQYLADAGIGTEIHYPVPPHLQPCYAGILDSVRMPVAERLAAEILSLPIANVTPQETAYIARTINGFKN